MVDWGGEERVKEVEEEEEGRLQRKGDGYQVGEGEEGEEGKAESSSCFHTTEQRSR